MRDALLPAFPHRSTAPDREWILNPCGPLVLVSAWGVASGAVQVMLFPSRNARLDRLARSFRGILSVASLFQGNRSLPDEGTGQKDRQGRWEVTEGLSPGFYGRMGGSPPSAHGKRAPLCGGALSYSRTLMDLICLPELVVASISTFWPTAYSLANDGSPANSSK